MKRRDFLKFIGVTGAVGAGSSWAADQLWNRVKQNQPAQYLAEPGGIEQWKNTICKLCSGGCGIKVRLIDGLPVNIKGNPIYSVNRGGLCPLGHSGLQQLYNPDRIRGPLRRTGPPGAYKWEPIGWNKALSIINDKLARIRQSGNVQRLAFMDGGSRGLLKMIFKQFLAAHGTPNYIRTDDWENRTTAYRFMQGHIGTPGFDLEHTQFIMSFGADLLEAESSAVWFSRHLSGMRHRAGHIRGRLVQIESRFSVTAVKSDKWIPVRPGTEGALALGIAHMMIQENICDNTFIDKHTFGFDDWTDDAGDQHMGFKQLVLANYYPEVVKHITGVPVEDIILLAHAFAENQPAVAICGKGVARHPNGFYSQMAVHSLNALTGNIGRSGGIVSGKGLPFGAWPKPELDENARRGLQEPRIDKSGSISFPLAHHLPANLSQQILARDPYPIEMLFLYKSNPVFELPGSEEMKTAMASIPFVVSFSNVMDETSEYAHLILPDNIYLESWQEDFNVPYTYFEHFGVGPPVIEPIGNTKSTGDVILALAKSAGGAIARSLPYQDYFSVIKWAAKQIFESGRGFIVREKFDTAWMEYLQRRGWRSQRNKTFEEFWQDLIKYGGWMEPVQRDILLKDAFDTPSKKYEFYMLGLKQEFEKHARSEIAQKNSSLESAVEVIAGNLKIEARGDTMYLPHHEAVRFAGDEFEYPYYLIPFELNVIGDGAGANSPMMMEMVGFRQNIRWDSWVEIHPETAGEVGVSSGDLVFIESPAGKVKTRVQIFAGAQPDMINIPMGLGHTAVGKQAGNKGVNPNILLAKDFDFLSGVPATLGTRVKIYKA